MKAIPESRTLKEAKLKAGYSEESRQVYRKHTKAHIAKILTEQGISKDTLKDYFQGLAELAIKTGDLSNANRSGENIGKLFNLMKDAQNVQQVVFNEDITKGLPPRKVDITVDGQAQGDVNHCDTST